MVRTIVTPDNAHIELDIPVDYIGRRIEVSYLLLDEINSSTKKKTMADFWGILSDETANGLHTQIKKDREEWDRDI